MNGDSNPVFFRNKRVYGLDTLRGLCALGVASYHYSSWLSLNVVSLNVGYYGVYLFFVISGVSIYISYSSKICTIGDFRNFILIRYCRLLPLFLLVLLVGPFVQTLSLDSYNIAFWEKAFVNLAFIFGIGNPGVNSLVTGGWSLGIEFMFYAFFPVFLAFFSKSKISLALLFFMQLIFVNLSAVNNDWYVYIQPLAFVWYFAIGCYIGQYYLSNTSLTSRSISRLGLLVAVLILVFWILNKPTSMSETLTGAASLYMPFSCAVLVFAFLSCSGGKVSVFLGKISYGTYLLHPLVFYFLERSFSQLPLSVRYVFFLAITLFFSFFLDKYFEQPVLDWAKKRFPVGLKSAKSPV